MDAHTHYKLFPTYYKRMNVTFVNDKRGRLIGYGEDHFKMILEQPMSEITVYPDLPTGWTMVDFLKEYMNSKEVISVSGLFHPYDRSTGQPQKITGATGNKI